MRAKSLFGASVMIFSLLLAIPAMTTGQPGGGGFGKGQFGGKSKGGGMMSQADPSQVFEFLSRGRGYFLISDTRTFRDPLAKYAQEKGITNGQITKAQFVDFFEGFKAKMAPPAAPPMGGGPAPASPSPPDGGKGGFKGFGSPRGGPPVPPGANATPEALNEWADKEFERRDSNGDRRLNRDEMPSSLRSSLTTWDRDGDGFISITEFREYFHARVTGGDSKDPNKGIAAIIIDDDELDRKPIVYRAGGKMPANMPAWFKELDTDSDGQVSFAEWRRGGKVLDEFMPWDKNDDGFITPEEASKHYATLGTGKDNKTVAGGERPSFGGKGNRPSFGGFPQGDGKTGMPAFGGFGKGGFFGKTKKSDRQP